MEEAQLVKITSEASHNIERSSVKQYLDDTSTFLTKLEELLKEKKWGLLPQFLSCPHAHIKHVYDSNPDTRCITKEKELTNYVGKLKAKTKFIANMCNALYKKDCHTKSMIIPTHPL